MDTVQCIAENCLEESRDIPTIGGTNFRKGKRSIVLGTAGNRDLGWTHLDCERTLED